MLHRWWRRCRGRQILRQREERDNLKNERDEDDDEPYQDNRGQRTDQVQQSSGMEHRCVGPTGDLVVALAEEVRRDDEGDPQDEQAYDDRG